MTTLEKIFDHWHREQSTDNRSINDKWNNMLEYLYTNCPESVREKLLVYILDFSYLAEQEAFSAGYREAFFVWMDILNISR